MLFILASCEKVVNIDIQQKEERLVVDALVSSLPDQTYVRLSKTSPLFSAQNYGIVSQATVKISSSTGDEFLMEETEPGIYTNANIVGEEGVEYSLEVDWDNEKIEALSKMPNIVAIDSLELVISPSGFMGKDEETYSLKVHFNDPVNEANYYRYDIFNNDSLHSGFIVSNDLFYNGLKTFQFLMNQGFKPLDSVTVQLSSIDQLNYSYFLVLSQGDSPFNIAPGNPISNLQGNAIGYFGAYAQFRKTIIIPE